MRRKILGFAGAAVTTAATLIALTGGPAHASTSCEGRADGTIILNNPGGGAYTWVFECYGDGKARYVGYIKDS